MINAQLYYRLCLIQGLCLTVGLGVPILLHSFTPILGKWNLQGFLLAWVTVMGTWGLLTVGTGLTLLRQMRRHSRRQDAPPRSVSTRPDSLSPSTPSFSSPGSLKLFVGEEQGPEDHPEWKSRWRQTS